MSLRVGSLLMEGKPYRGTRGGAKSRKKKFFERQDLVRNHLRTLAARWGHEFQLPRVEYNPDDPTVTAIEDVEWELIDSLDSLVIHVLAVTVPELKRLLDRLEFSVDKKPKLAPGGGCPEPRPWQIVGAAGGPRVMASVPIGMVVTPLEQTRLPQESSRNRTGMYRPVPAYAYDIPTACFGFAAWGTH